MKETGMIIFLCQPETGLTELEMIQFESMK